MCPAMEGLENFYNGEIFSSTSEQNGLPNKQWHGLQIGCWASFVKYLSAHLTH